MQAHCDAHCLWSEVGTPSRINLSNIHGLNLELLHEHVIGLQCTVRNACVPNEHIDGSLALEGFNDGLSTNICARREVTGDALD